LDDFELDRFCLKASVVLAWLCQAPVEAVSKVKISQIQLSNWMFNFISPLQTSPEGAALKSSSGDLGVLPVSVLSNCKFLKEHNHF
jgi:hypothetical protein